VIRKPEKGLRGEKEKSTISREEKTRKREEKKE